ncbi:MAG: 23S rRNA (uracil(1939)-C(5))-methyltransferase RlmD [Bacteroidales bacterium]
MGRKRRNIVHKNVRIEDIGSEGKSIARVDGRVIFVSKALPGDIADLKVIKNKKNYQEAIPVKFHAYSDMRITPFCSHFDVCGGCKWQDLPYDEQLKYKAKQVSDNFERIGKVSVKAAPIVPSVYTQYYRNKLEFTFTNFRWMTEEELELAPEEKNLNGLGFHIPGRWDKIVDVEHCFLQKEPSNEIRNAIKDYALKNNYSFFDLRKQEGFLRNLIIRISSCDEVMVVLIMFYEDQEKRKSILDYIAQKFPQITSLMYMINPKANDSIYDLEPELYKGRDYIVENMEDLQFKLGPKSFFQTNSFQALELYKLVRHFASLQGNEIVYDLYTGTGTIANFIAPEAKKVVGIESVPEAVMDAKTNAEINNIENTEFVAGDMKDILDRDFMMHHGYPDVIITDPPRAGMHKKVVQNILDAQPERIVYVSCNPATQSRDVNLLSEKYEVDVIQPVDMFPHTYHVENIALLTIRQ